MKSEQVVRKFTHPSGKVLSFEPKFHQYTMSGVGKLTSCSKVLNKYFPFDEAKVSAIVSKKTGQSTEDVLQGWKKQALLGHNVHGAIEGKLLNQPVPSPDALHGDEDAYIKVAMPAVDKVLAQYETLHVEMCIASAQLGIAGTVDYIGRNKTTGAILIADWKTTGTVLSSFRFGSFETPCPSPVAHLPNSKSFRYAMQILLYGYILRQEGYSSILGKELLSVPMEFGIVQIGKTDGGSVEAEFKRVSSEDILPADMAYEIGIDDLLRSIVQN